MGTRPNKKPLPSSFTEIGQWPSARILAELDHPFWWADHVFPEYAIRPPLPLFRFLYPPTTAQSLMMAGPDTPDGEKLNVMVALMVTLPHGYIATEEREQYVQILPSRATGAIFIFVKYEY